MLPTINFFWAVNVFIGRGSSGYEKLFRGSSMERMLGNTGVRHFAK
jgi:hypothetical protein